MNFYEFGREKNYSLSQLIRKEKKYCSPMLPVKQLYTKSKTNIVKTKHYKYYIIQKIHSKYTKQYIVNAIEEMYTKY